MKYTLMDTENNNGEKNQLIENTIQNIDKLIGPAKAQIKAQNNLIKNTLDKNIPEYIKDILSVTIKNNSEIMELINSHQPNIPEYKKARVEKLSTNRWVFDITCSFNLLNEISDMNNSEVDEFMLKHFSDNDYENLFFLLNHIEEDVHPWYKEIAKDSARLLREDINNYRVLYSNFINMLENVIICELGDKSQRKQDKATDVIKCRISKRIEAGNGYELEDFSYQSLEVAKKYFVNRNNEVPSRHSVNHGNYDMNKIKLVDFIKLVSLVSTLYIVALTE